MWEAALKIFCIFAISVSGNRTKPDTTINNGNNT